MQGVQHTTDNVHVVHLVRLVDIRPDKLEGVRQMRPSVGADRCPALADTLEVARHTTDSPLDMQRLPEECTQEELWERLYCPSYPVTNNLLYRSTYELNYLHRSAPWQAPSQASEKAPGHETFLSMPGGRTRGLSGHRPGGGRSIQAASGMDEVFPLVLFLALWAFRDGPVPFSAYAC